MTATTRKPRSDRGKPRKPARARQTGFRMEPDVTDQWDEYRADVECTFTETVNLALRRYFDIESLPAEDWQEVQHILSKAYPDRYIRTRD